MQKVGLYGACILFISLVLCSKTRVVQRAEVREVEVCARVQAFVDAISVGIVVSPSPTEEERKAVELANARMRSLLTVLLRDGVCGRG